MVARVMVELDTAEGLPFETEVTWGVKVFRKKLDYLHIPFRCFYCINMGHVKGHCPYMILVTQPTRSEVLVDSPSL